MAFEIDIGYVCEGGRKEPNEDFCAAMLPPAGQAEKGSIVAIADGVSAGGMGKEAAQTTVTSLVRDYYGTPDTWDTTVALDRIIGAQNTWLAGINRRRHPAMGLTTLTALVLRGHGYTLAHVGDTRAYLLRDGRLAQLTHDHASTHPDFSHQLLRCIGAEDWVVVDYSQGDLLPGDRFLLMTDGIHNVLNEGRLKALLDEGEGASSSQSLCEALVAAALQRDSTDNVTALVVRVLGLDDETLADQNRLADQLPVPRKLRIGEQLDGLTVEAIVADNAVNLVYQVRDAVSGRRFALKTLHPQRAHDRQERAMLAHEAWLAHRMGTSRAADHLVALHDALPGGRSPGAYYLLYDWHGGETLEQLLALRQRLGPVQVAGMAVQVARVLGHLHRQGVIHRDVKPANLHQGEDGVLRLLDLGVALSGREPESARTLHAGTPSFINPEQWGFRLRRAGVDTDAPPEPANARSDLFALGVTLYQLLTGKLPYGDVLPYQAGRYFRDPIAPSRHNPEVPIWLDHIVLKAVNRDQKQRFETAEELLLALERGASRPLTAPPGTPLIRRDPTMLWKLLLGFSVLFNGLLVYWLAFLPR
jgi:serine/threonine protein phosphatase PrpC